MSKCCMSGEELAMAASTLAVLVAKNKSCIEIAVMAKFFNTVADNLRLIVEQKAVCGDCKEPKP